MKVCSWRCFLFQPVRQVHNPLDNGDFFFAQFIQFIRHPVDFRVGLPNLLTKVGNLPLDFQKSLPPFVLIAVGNRAFLFLQFVQKMPEIQKVVANTVRIRKTGKFRTPGLA